MKIELTDTEKEELELKHRKERDRCVADRIKAVLLNGEGWTQKQIAQALRIRYETVQDHLDDYRREKKLKPENGGSQSHLNPSQTMELTQHLEAHTYLKAELICAHVEKTYHVGFYDSWNDKVASCPWIFFQETKRDTGQGRPAKTGRIDQILS